MAAPYAHLSQTDVVRGVSTKNSQWLGRECKEYLTRHERYKRKATLQQ